MGSEEVLTLRPSRRKAALFLILCIGFVWIGAMAIRKDGGFMPWFCSTFFALCAIVFVVLLLPGASYLRLHAEGFDVCSLYRKWPTIRWTSASHFRVARVPPVGHALIVFDAEGLGRQSLQSINRGLAGAGAALPDAYGMKPQELADLMNTWRSRATGR